MSATKTKYLLGVYDDDETMMDAVDNIQGRGLHVEDVFAPFPVHGLEHKLHLKRSRLPKAAFWFGALGLCTALFLEIYTMGVYVSGDLGKALNSWGLNGWPINVGGKPFVAVPSFIPVAFELTVLFASLGMVGVYLFVNRLGPGVQAQLADIRQTDDRFVILVKHPADSQSQLLVQQAFRDTGALDVRDTELLPLGN